MGNQRSLKNQIEILAPAGSWDSLEAAVKAGADAVYIGGKRFGARAFADNFDREELLEAIDYVHIHGRKIYLTVNTLFKDEELLELYEYLLPYYSQGLDAVIVQDLGAMALVKEAFPGLSLHVSTQATVTGVFGAEFFKERGASRIVPARELSLDEVRRMKQISGLEIECFVHGALCYCYSGQCLLSSMIGGRSGNRGQCAQPCRLPFAVEDGKQKNLMSLKDLCTIDLIPELIEAGIDSFKIEGRMKQPDYVYTVVSMYRKYIDLYKKYGTEGFFVADGDRDILQGSYRRRGYTKGYYYQHNGKDMLSLSRPKEEISGGLCVPSDKMKEKINGKLILSEGEHAKLYVELKDIKLLCEGAEVQQAKNQPLDAERIEKQMRKTGNTDFEFDNLDIVTKGSVFLPMQALNELRREAAGRLRQEILSGYYRKDPESKKMALNAVGSGRFSQRTEGMPELSVLVSDEKQLYQLLEDERIDTVYVDGRFDFSAVCERRSDKQRVFLALPRVFREDTARRWETLYEKVLSVFDGVLIRNWESYQWLKEHKYPKEIRSDSNLYVFNKQSRNAAGEAGIGRYFAPAELNHRELKELGLNGGGLIVYGRQPVMITANCIRKNTNRCSREEGRRNLKGRQRGKRDWLYLTDRYQKKFPVKNHCADCYNVIYNCQPLMLLVQQKEVKELGAAELRLDLTLETAEEAEQIIRAYWECFKNGLPAERLDIDYTKGHFRRGVK